MAKNHLFSFKNSYGEKMYAIVVGAKSAQAARDYLPEKFRKFEGTVEGIPKSAYDADVFYADKSERRYDYDPDDPDTAMEIERERKYDLKNRPQAEKDKEEADAVRYEAESELYSQKFQKRNESKAMKFITKFSEGESKKYRLIPEEGFTRKESDAIRADRYETSEEAMKAAKDLFQTIFRKEVDEYGRTVFTGQNKQGYSASVAVVNFPTAFEK